MYTQQDNTVYSTNDPALHVLHTRLAPKKYYSPSSPFSSSLSLSL